MIASMSITKRNFLLYLTVFTLVVGGLGLLALRYWLPGDYFSGFYFVLAYYFAFGVFNISMFDICRRKAPQKLVLLYLALKVMKIIVSVVVMLIYCVAAVRDNVHGFLLVFIAYYLLYLIFETWFFFLFEINRKRKTITKNETNA